MCKIHVLFMDVDLVNEYCDLGGFLFFILFCIFWIKN